MSKYDEINEVKKADSIDHIEEVEKFNPFHDSLGKFSSSNGFKSYSANPKTKAGAMAIQRSAAAGHGRTMNVHRESKGESIAQNDRWLKTGQKPKVPAAVSRARYQQRKLKQQQAAQQAQQNQQNQAQQKPAPKKPTQTTQQNQQNQNQKPAQPTQQHTIATGKDISQTVKIKSGMGANSPVNQVADAQGFRGKPKVVSQAEFDKAVQDSGVIAYRTVSPGKNVVTGKTATSKEFADAIMHGDAQDFSLNGTGGQVYGGGMYITTNPRPKKGTVPNGTKAKQDSAMYGSRGRSTQIQMTVDPSAKIGDYSKVYTEFHNQPYATRTKFGYDVGAYAAAKGYDGLRAKGAGWGCDYVTVYNRTKMIMLDTTESL